MNDDVIREHPAFRRWLVGLAGGMLFLLLLLPNTGWLVREHLHLQIFGYRADPSVKSVREVAARMPGDPEIQIAALSMADNYKNMASVLALRELFPANRVVLATILRAYTRSLRLGRQGEVVDYLSGKQSAAQPEEPEFPVPLEDQDVAVAGEQADPDNAYFPLMLAVSYFAAHRDAEALDAVVRAGACSRWDDYVQQEAFGRERIGDLLSGHPSALTTFAEDGAILFPHLSEIRQVVGLTTFRAAKAEEAGNTEEGLRLRMAVARCGELMRTQGRSLITSLVGVAIVQLAQERPGGEFSAAEPGPPPPPGSERDETAERRRSSRFCTYLENYGHGREARWFREQERATEESRQIVALGTDSAIFELPSLKLYLLHAADALLLSNVLWMALAGLSGAALCRFRRIAAGQPLPIAVRHTNLALAVGAALLIAVGSQREDFALLLAPWIISGTAGWLFYLVVLRRHRHLESTARAVITSAGWSLLSVAIIAALGGAVFWQTRGSQDLIKWVPSMLNSPGGQPASVWWTDTTVIVLSAVCVPVLSAVFLAGFSLVLRVPLSVGLARGFRAAALPVCCLLLLGFGGSVLATSVQEARVLHGIHRMVEHEGTYFAELLGRQWPGLVR